MKILVVNLLRLGDVVANASAIKAIRGRFPQAEIHLMVNSNFANAASLIAGVDRTVLFERDRLQAACVEAERPMFEAFDWLSGFVERACEEKYDLLYNFTHNRLSGWLCGLITAPEKIGLVLDGSGAVSFGSAWFRHLNQQVDFDESQSFNHADIFIGAAGGWDQVGEQTFFDNLLIETAAGRTEASLYSASLAGGPSIALQISTSDSKKEWGDLRFRVLAENLLSRHPELTIFVVGAPDEKARIDKFCQSIEGDSARIRPAVLSLAGVVSFLEQVDVLVTGDTSIKHFGSAGTVQIVELIVGSADAYRTGSWKAGDLIVASRELCAPCGHTEACHRATHACAISIPPDAVTEVVSPLIGGEIRSVHMARLSMRMDVKIFEVDRSEGLVTLIPVNDTILSDESLALVIERSARRLALESRDGKFDRSKFGSETLKSKSSLINRFVDSTALDIRHALSDGEYRLRHAEGIVQSLKLQLSRLKESFQDPQRIHEVVSSIIAIRSRLQKSPWTRFIAEPLMQVIEDDRSAPFARFRKLSDAVQDLELRIGLALKLIRSLEIEFENENIDKSAMGDRL